MFILSLQQCELLFNIYFVPGKWCDTSYDGCEREPPGYSGKDAGFGSKYQ